MKTLYYTIVIILAFIQSGYSQNSAKAKRKTVVIHFEDYESLLEDTIKIGYQSAYYVLQPNYVFAMGRFKNSHEIKWEIPCENASLLDLSMLLGRTYRYVLVEPGDSIAIMKRNGGTQVCGVGSEKIEFIKSFVSDTTALSRRIKSEYDKTISTNDFWKIDVYCDSLVSILNALCKRRGHSLSEFAFNYLKANLLADIEYIRICSFNILAFHREQNSLTIDSLNSIFEEKIKSENFRFLKGYTGPIQNYVYYFLYLRLQSFSNHNYNKSDSVIRSVKQRVEYYSMAKEKFAGYPLMSNLTSLLTHMGLKDYTWHAGYSYEIDSLLDEFYTITGYPDYTEYVKKYEMKILSWVGGKNCNTYDFTLKNSYGKDVHRSDFKGKIVLLNFWDPGFPSSIEINRILSHCMSVFKNDTNFVLLNITLERNRHEPVDYIEKQMNLHRQFSLFVPKNKNNVAVMKGYNLARFPKLYLLDETGKSFFYQFDDTSSAVFPFCFPDPRKDGGALLVDNIKEKISQLNDGPYITEFGDSTIKMDYIVGRNFTTTQKNKNFKFRVSSDEYQGNFTVPLSDTIVIPPSVYNRTKKIFAVSDIEGNFKALRKLLVSNKVMNENYEWIFGDGHLVVNGDLFDRGKQVTECLWLLYLLEQNARRADGYVHFILGNHEIMNLNGDLRYMNTKYKENFFLSGKSYKDIWGSQSVLGRWVRSKNVIEKIGDIVFVHAGISPQIASLNISIDSINRLFRGFFNVSTSQKLVDSTMYHLLVESNESPLWYRGYYTLVPDQKIKNHINKTLSQFKASRIVTGHTIAADSVNIHYGGSLVNIDTPHAKGKSEALLIENNRYFRVDALGNKRELLAIPPSVVDGPFIN